MADVRCPMCGKANPEEQEICQHCQARMKPLRLDSAGSDPAASSPENKPGGRLGNDLPDWLSSFRSGEEDEAPGESEENVLPDWLQSAAPEQPAQSDLPDWLTSLREPDQPAAPEQTGTPSSNVEPSLDQEAGGEEEPDWLRGIPSEPQPAPLSGSAGQVEGEGDLPDWLSPEESSESSPPSGEPDGLSGWTAWMAASQRNPDPSHLDFESDPEEQEEQVEPEAETAQDLPAWMKDMEAGVDFELPELEDVPTKPTGDLPDWVSRFPSKTNPEELPDGEASELEPSEDLPDWLRSLEQRASHRPAEPANSPASAADREPDDEQGELADIPEGTDENALPAWLQGVESAGPLPGEVSPPEPEPSSPSPVSPFMLDDEAEAELEPLLEGDLPDWLASVTSSDYPATETPETPVEAPAGAAAFEEEDPASQDSSLTPATLPSWLEAMRPVDRAADLSDAAAGAVENAGPLAGIRGALPAEPLASQVGKPAAHQMKLQITDVQRKNADLLANMVKTEADAVPVPKRIGVPQQQILRILMGVLLFLAVLVPLLFDIPVSTPPLNSMPDVEAVNGLINGVVTGEPVLVSFDYEPGWSAEMEALAVPLLDHLMLRGAYIVLVSTSPTGPALAEKAVAQANSFHPEGARYLPGTHYTNLGYIPGGPAGLLAFARSPRLALAGSGWEAGPLPALNALSDFRLALVFTENPDTARIWVEQVTPSLAGTPLLMAVSAQADPLVRPYFGAGSTQVDGLISGLDGSAYYEGLNGRLGFAHRYWSSFSLGLYTAAGLLLLGGLINAVSGLLERRKIARAEE